MNRINVAARCKAIVNHDRAEEWAEQRERELFAAYDRPNALLAPFIMRLVDARNTLYDARRMLRTHGAWGRITATLREKRDRTEGT